MGNTATKPQDSTLPALEKSGRSTKSLTILVLLIAVLVPLLSTIPTWYGYLAQRPPNKIFMGFRNMADDHYSYASLVNQAVEEGKFFTENRFTTEPQKGRFLLLYMWVVGQISKLTGLGVVGSWELSRLLAGFAFMVMAWVFSGLLFHEIRSRLLAYVFVGFSGGIGWILYVLTAQLERGSSDPYLRDAFNYQWNWSTFGSMLTPLWIAPAAILLLCAYLIAARQVKLKPFWGILLPPIIWFMHPYTGIAAYLTFFLFPLLPALGAIWRLEQIPWKSVRERVTSVLPMLASVVAVIAYILWARQDQVYAISAQRVLTWNPTYSIFLYPFAYGLLLPLAMYGIKWSESLPVYAKDVLVAWLAASTILSLNPFLAGVKFQYLVHLPLAFFAAHGLLELRRRSPYLRNLLKGVGVVLFGSLLFLNSPLIILKDFPATASDKDIFLSAAEIEAMNFLRQQPSGNVLSSAWAGNRIAWLAAKKVYVGHWFLTIKQNEKLAEVQAFFGPQLTGEEKKDWLASRGIRYVYYGPIERSVGVVDDSLGLTKIYDQNGVTIFAVP